MSKNPFSACHHVYNKSISDYVIYRDDHDYQRMLHIFEYYRFANPPMKFSDYWDRRTLFQLKENREEKVRILAYCLMPTHFHLVVEFLGEGALSSYTNVCLNAYTHYFNKRYARKGPLWQNRTQRVHVGRLEEFLFVSRYVHLNPATSYLVEDPLDWVYSSYGQYISKREGVADLRYLGLDAESYQAYVLSHKEAQRMQAKMKKLP